MKNWHNDHIEAVAKRWREKRIASELPADEFEAFARKTLTDYGWAGDDLEKIIRICMK